MYIIIAFNPLKLPYDTDSAVVEREAGYLLDQTMATQETITKNSRPLSALLQIQSRTESDKGDGKTGTQTMFLPFLVHQWPPQTLLY